jgi:hypothetical protein
MQDQRAGIGEIELFDLRPHHLTDREKTNLQLRVGLFAQVVEAKIVGDALSVTLNLGKLPERACRQAVEVLMHRISTEIERCKVRRLRSVYA